MAEFLAENNVDIYAKDNKDIAAIDYCNNKRVKQRLIKLASKHIQATIKSVDKPEVMINFDVER